MPSLREVQQAFGRAISTGDSSLAAGLIAGNGIDPAARLRIYGNNHRENSLAALRSTYPVVERLVGADYFRQMALDYFVAHPSRSGNLDRLGEHLREFLAARFGDGEHRYLADIARLEWCCQEVAAASGHAPFDIEKLRAVPPQRYPTLVFKLHPAVRLVNSRFPVLRIWRANQPDGDASELIELDAPERVLVTRAGHRVELRLLDAGEFKFLVAVENGESLERCAARAAAHGDFDASGALSRFVSAGILADFSAG